MEKAFLLQDEVTLSISGRKIIINPMFMPWHY